MNLESLAEKWRHGAIRVLTVAEACEMRKKYEHETDDERFRKCMEYDWQLHGDKYGAKKPWWMK
jgi:hypothetical protein